MSTLSTRFLLCCIVPFAAAFSERPACAVDYLTDIKPLLEEKCYACHGPLKAQGDLRLDTAVALIAGGGSGAAIQPGDPGESFLIDVLTGEAGYQMPPENEGAVMTPAQIDLFRRWIADGAPSPADEEPAADPKTWWSYQAITRPPLPEVDDTNWPRGPIDHFVAARRQANGLPHAPPADRATWLRRVYLDLIGLPPTVEQQQAFLNDDSPMAFEAVVDELLSRPEYGQRWGRHWMDVWRYSDWYGSRGSNEIRYSQRHIWRWRDWIVDSLNDNKGYAAMVREMLSGDERIDPADPASLVATGYLGRSWYKFDRDVWLFETVERTGEAFLGLTLRCCRCHDHKFDPVSHEEYFRFRSFFEPHDVRTDPISVLTEMQKDASQGMVPTDGIPLVYDKTADAPTYRFERGDSRFPDKSKTLEPGVPQSLGGSVDLQPIDLPALAWYPMLRPGVRETLIEKATSEAEAAAAALADAQAALREMQDKPAAESLAEKADDADDLVLLHDNFDAPNPKLWKIQSGDWKWEEGSLRQTEVRSFATIVADRMLPLDFKFRLRYRTLAAGSFRSVGLSFDYQDAGNSQDVYTSVNDSQPSVQAFHREGGQQAYPAEGIVYTPLKVGEEIVLDVTVAGSQLTIDMNGTRKLDYQMPIARRSGKLALWVHQGAAEFLELEVTRLPPSAETLALQQREAKHAVDLARLKHQAAQAHVESTRLRIAAEVKRYLDPQSAEEPEDLDRWLAAAAEAEARLRVCEAEVEFFEAAPSAEKLEAAKSKLAAAEAKLNDPANRDYEPLGPQFPRTSTGRRSALANWIVDPQNPRTARVAANHLWGRHFGQPLVATTENFGLNGRKPSHPQLLDWLADELIRNDWKMKPLHRQIVLSATYRMSSDPLPVGIDAALEVDPENRLLWRMNPRRMEAELVRDSTLFLASQIDLSFGGPEIPVEQGDISRRRSLYLRNTPNEKVPMLEVFDVADPNACYRRQESIVPHQSLAMMNSGLAIDAARTIARRLADASDFVDVAFATILARRPTAAETERCNAFLQSHAELLQQASGEKFPGADTATTPRAAAPLQAARENLIHVLMLHNDFVTIR
ncbi:PSD1 and planctomycete cytochrome C domain-containing protein [Rosistilla oblonga]|uniref:PSD1 and planctomycete cytochrome C domain-containing protein n=1 Tax=Rosistilla oblonga TaxID=2527990 RepID=UPI003A977D73